jgi:hypothetical protein
MPRPVTELLAACAAVLCCRVDGTTHEVMAGPPHVMAYRALGRDLYADLIDAGARS